MHIHYTGKLKALTPAEEKRLATRFVRLGALLDRGSEKEVHVILAKDRRGHRAEITLNHRHHELAGKAEGAADQLTVLTAALDKLEKQILKLKAKVTEGKRRSVSATRASEPAEKIAEPAEGPEVMRVRIPARKPMTTEEAVLLVGKKPYLVFRDAETNAVNVLIRRGDGNFDLVES
jgi:putative sigma-54 modulation protein